MSKKTSKPIKRTSKLLIKTQARFLPHKIALKDYKRVFKGICGAMSSKQFAIATGAVEMNMKKRDQ